MEVSRHCGGGSSRSLGEKGFDEGIHKVCLCSILVDGVLLQATFFFPPKLAVHSEKICFASWREETEGSQVIRVTVNCITKGHYVGILLKVFADRAEAVLTIVCSLYRLLQYISCYLAQGEAQRKEWTKYVRKTVKNGAPKAMSNSSKFLSTFWRSGKGFTGSSGGLIKKIEWYKKEVVPV